MIVVVILGIVWCGLALCASILLGRAASRADDEELGSQNDWDVAEIDHEVFGSR